MKALFLAGGKGTNLKPVTTQNVTLRIWQSDLTRSSNKSNLPAHTGSRGKQFGRILISTCQEEVFTQHARPVLLEEIRSLSN